MSDSCKTKELQVSVQENGIIRNMAGRLIGRLGNEVDFDSEDLTAASEVADEMVDTEGGFEPWHR